MIRRATAADLSTLVKIQDNNGYNAWSEKSLKETLSKGYCVVLEHQNSLIGFALFSSVFDEAELLNIVLLENYQGKGMAAALLMQALSDLKDDDVRSCFLEVGINNQKAIQLYEKLGFKPTGKRENYYKTDNGTQDALLMQYQLQE